MNMAMSSAMRVLYLIIIFLYLSKNIIDVIKAIPSGLLSYHLSFHEGTRPEGTSVLLLIDINIQDKKCNNEHILYRN